MNNFYYQPGPAGSGKTFQLSHWAVTRALNHDKVLIAQPTKALLKETLKAIQRINPDIKIAMIVSGSRHTAQRVLARAVEHMDRATPHEGEVLLLTHETLKRLPDAMRKFWHMVCDEIPSVLVHHDLRIARTHTHMTAHVRTKPLVPGILALEVGNRAALEDVAINPTEDQNIATFSPVVNALLSGDQLVLVDEDKFTDLLTNPKTTGHVDFFCILMESFVKGYASTTFMGANAEESELFVLWSKLFNVNWMPHPELGNLLRYSTHQNGSRLTLHYLFDGTPSKRFLSMEDDEGDTNLDRIAKGVLHFMSGSRFLWHANKNSMLKGFDLADMLPIVSHGRNEPHFVSCHRVALLSAMNRKSPAYAFLESLGISQHQAQVTLGYQSDYQAMMRCSLRDPNATAPVDVVIGSKDAAQWIASKFPGCRVEHLDIGIEGPRRGGRPLETNKGRALTSTERSRALRARRKAAK